MPTIRTISLETLTRAELIACVLIFGVDLGPFIIADCSTETMRERIWRHIADRLVVVELEAG